MVSGSDEVAVLAAERAAALRRPTGPALMTTRQAAEVMGVPLWRASDPAVVLELGAVRLGHRLRLLASEVWWFADPHGPWLGAAAEHALGRAPRVAYRDRMRAAREAAGRPSAWGPTHG